MLTIIFVIFVADRNLTLLYFLMLAEESAAFVNDSSRIEYKVHGNERKKFKATRKTEVCISAWCWQTEILPSDSACNNLFLWIGLVKWNSIPTYHFSSSVLYTMTTSQGWRRIHLMKLINLNEKYFC